MGLLFRARSRSLKPVTPHASRCSSRVGGGREVSQIASNERVPYWQFDTIPSMPSVLRGVCHLKLEAY